MRADLFFHRLDLTDFFEKISNDPFFFHDLLHGIQAEMATAAAAVNAVEVNEAVIINTVAAKMTMFSVPGELLLF